MNPPATVFVVRLRHRVADIGTVSRDRLDRPGAVIALDSGAALVEEEPVDAMNHRCWRARG